MPEPKELGRIRELLEVLVAIELEDKGVPQAKISKIIRRDNNWTSALLRHLRNGQRGD